LWQLESFTAELVFASIDGPAVVEAYAEIDAFSRRGTPSI